VSRTTAGHRGLREAIARHIGISRGVETSADDVTVTSGNVGSFSKTMLPTLRLGSAISTARIERGLRRLRHCFGARKPALRARPVGLEDLDDPPGGHRTPRGGISLAHTVESPAGDSRRRTSA
jgi:hypothetical protein